MGGMSPFDGFHEDHLPRLSEEDREFVKYWINPTRRPLPPEAVTQLQGIRAQLGLPPYEPNG